MTAYDKRNTIIANSITVAITNKNKARLMQIVHELLEIRAINCDDAELLLSCAEAL
jgi:hypothetical protein